MLGRFTLCDERGATSLSLFERHISTLVTKTNEHRSPSIPLPSSSPSFVKRMHCLSGRQEKRDTMKREDS